jgi:hypothetical protein
MDSSVSDARDTTTKFSLEPKIVDGEACISSSGFGIASWLKSVDAAVSDPGGLPLKEKSHSFGLTFGVRKGGGASAEVNLVVIPVSIDARSLSKRDDVQVLTMALAPIPPDEVVRVEIVPRQAMSERRMMPLGREMNDRPNVEASGPATRTVTRRIVPDLSADLDRTRRQLLAIE